MKTEEHSVLRNTLFMASRLLQSLLLYDLPGIRDRQRCYKALRRDLPDCNIVYKDIEAPDKSGG